MVPPKNHPVCYLKKRVKTRVDFSFSKHTYTRVAHTYILDVCSLILFFVLIPFFLTLGLMGFPPGFNASLAEILKAAKENCSAPLHLFFMIVELSHEDKLLFFLELFSWGYLSFLFVFISVNGIVLAEFLTVPCIHSASLRETLVLSFVLTFAAQQLQAHSQVSVVSLNSVHFPHHY